METLLGTMKLRAEYRVRSDPAGARYLVEKTVRSDSKRSYAEPVSFQAVASVAEFLRHGSTTVAKMVDRVSAHGPRTLGLQYSYGHQLQYEIQRALVVLVARGEATVTRAGRGFVYSRTG